MIFSNAKLQKQKIKKGDKCYQTLFFWNTVKKQNMFIFASQKSLYDLSESKSITQIKKQYIKE